MLAIIILFCTSFGIKGHPECTQILNRFLEFIFCSSAKYVHKHLYVHERVFVCHRLFCEILCVGVFWRVHQVGTADLGTNASVCVGLLSARVFSERLRYPGMPLCIDLTWSSKGGTRHTDGLCTFSHPTHKHTTHSPVSVRGSLPVIP